MNGKLIGSAAILGVLLGVWYCFTLSPPKPEAEVKETNEIIASMDVAAERFGEEIREHRVETKKKVVIIRDAVRLEILALDPDGLADAARHEISLWRGGSGGGLDSGPPRLGGDGRGILPQR
jgi:hypothetical protein